ncbi:unnamed protein product [Arabidopsis thaliana]|uniref:(thale cress) hypothetical protein n=1 Tax=Arabidopsis thaliana TaxID=3702 RepID=A0A7G2FIX4_ARATH|nr:unnamed protein product [Arabidopsis thaliana]
MDKRKLGVIVPWRSAHGFVVPPILAEHLLTFELEANVKTNEFFLEFEVNRYEVFLYNIHGTALLQCVFPNNHRLKAEKETRFDQHSSLLSFYSFDYPRWRVYKRMNVLRSRSIQKSLRHQIDDRSCFSVKILF